MILFNGERDVLRSQFAILKGAIFDLDGTLLDSDYVWQRVDEIFLGKRGIEIPADYADAVMPLGFYDVAKYTIERFNLPDAPQSVMAEWIELARHEYEYNVELMSGSREILEFCKLSGMNSAIATSSTRELFVTTIRRNGISHYFEKIGVMGEMERDKSDPDAYAEVADMLGLEAPDCVVFEDVPEGLRSAKTAGAFVIAYIGKIDESRREEAASEFIKFSDICTDNYKEVIGFLSDENSI